MSAEWLTVKQAAAKLGGVSDKLIYKLFHLGELIGAKIAGTIRIRAASVAAYFDAHSNRKPPPEKPAAGTAEPVKSTRKRRRSAPVGFRFVDPLLPERFQLPPQVACIAQEMGVVLANHVRRVAQQARQNIDRFSLLKPCRCKCMAIRVSCQTRDARCLAKTGELLHDFFS